MAFCCIKIMKFILVGIVTLFSLSFMVDNTLSVDDNKKEKVKKDKNQIKGEKFLKKNAKKRGVVTLESGLQYKVLKEGTGEKPNINSDIKAHYVGWTIKGQKFDSSRDRGKAFVFKPTRVIKGWQEAIQLMPVGSTWELYIPGYLAYGEKGAGDLIEPNSVLIFEVELLEIIK